MNQRQRITIFVGSLIIAAMLLFPPMIGYHPGYGFVFNRRSTYIEEYDQVKRTGNFNAATGWVSWRINQERLIFQILIVSVLTGGTFVLLGGKRD
jgi:hypothetical protein